MLELTDNAVEAVQEIMAASPEIDEDAGGLRIVATGAGLEVGLAALPGEDDEVVESEGVRLFLEADAADLLDDKVLDADIEGDEFAFTIVEQEVS